jgi:hypothetical protein
MHAMQWCTCKNKFAKLWDLSQRRFIVLGYRVCLIAHSQIFTKKKRETIFIWLTCPTNGGYIYIYIWPPLWSNGQSSWLQILRFEFDPGSYQIFWEVVGLERGPLSLVSTIEELLGRKSSGSGLENREYGSRDPSHWPRGNLYPQKLALPSSPTGGRSVGIVRSRIKPTEFSLVTIKLHTDENSGHTVSHI